MNKISIAKRTARLAILISIALILSAVERMIPVPIPIPGVKLGLANLATLIALYLMSDRDAAVISASRVLLAGFLFGHLTSILYALSGAMAALFVMAMLRRTNLFGVVGVSVAGGVAHVAAQLIVAALAVQTPALATYLAPLLFSGLLTGLLIGIVAALVIERIEPLFAKT